jgi:hypothetical protein
MASKDKFPAKYGKAEPQDKKQEHRHFKKTGSSDITNPQVFKKINPSELPVIGINSGGNISHIKMALITYCQKELGPISKIFTELKYQKDITVPFSAEDLSDKNDPLGIYKAVIIGRMKQADSDNLAYEKSKMKLCGILYSMTTKEMDERLSVHRSTIESKSTLPARSATVIATASEDTMHPTDTAFVNCPLSLWKDIVHVTTTKTAGNKRIDRDKLTVEFSTIRQRPNESLSDFHHRMSHTIESFEMLGLEKPANKTRGMRFIQGLDSARYSSMQTSFANELNNGRDLYPTDLPSAVLKASRWMVSGKSSQDSLRALAATKSGKDSKGDEDKDKSKTKGDTKSAVKCDFCGRTNHSMSACFQFKEAQTIAQDKDKRSRGMKKSTTMIAKSYKAPDSDDEERHYLANMHIKSHAASVLAARKRTKPKDWEIVLDTGANGSLFVNASLVTDAHRESTVSFDGISGVLSTDTVGDFNGLCKVHIHEDAIANILSFSQLRQMGHSIIYDQGERPDDDSFTITHPGGSFGSCTEPTDCTCTTHVRTAPASSPL